MRVFDRVENPGDQWGGAEVLGNEIARNGSAVSEFDAALKSDGKPPSELVDPVGIKARCTGIAPKPVGLLNA
jgi:hypothetical protein